MKHRTPSRLRSPKVWWHNTRLQHRARASAGLTLIELLVATLITTVVILILGSGMISALNGTRVAEARTARRIELNRAFDFMTNEIRQAKSINQHGATVADGTVTVADVITSSGISLSNLGSYGTLALYLEIPTGASAPAICPAGGPNAGSAPALPSDYDRVVYDIRPSPQGWLGPRTIHRYGRVPNIDGTINPCSTPVGSDVMMDAISQTMNTTPTCSTPGVLNGAEGFYTCVNGSQVDLFFQSRIVGSEVRKLFSAASSRLIGLNLPELVLTGNHSAGSNTVNLAWTWPGAANSTIYKVYKLVDGSTTELYSGSNLNVADTLAGSTGSNNCFTVKTIVSPGTTAQSNQLCFVKS